MGILFQEKARILVNDVERSRKIGLKQCLFIFPRGGHCSFDRSREVMRAAGRIEE